MKQLKYFIGDLSLKKKIFLLIILILSLGVTFLTFGDSTELRNLTQLVLQLGQIIFEEIGSKEPASFMGDIASL